ncbi:MAG: crossover junction endodeoxyribonuclease RuvC, crossover junction endodeoxyribonuclease RuvC [Candidatus Parcubacteria bacterium]|jgi:crossover junction endodeoxyribonuclease RuvC
MKVLGIDPGYERLGIAVLEKTAGSKEQLLYSACLRTSAKDSFEQRLLSLGKEIERVIAEFSPEALAIETLFLSNNQKTAMRVAEVRGMLIYLAASNGLTVEEINPLQIKLAVTGDGKSSKDQMMKMVALLIKMPNKKALDDEYDAIAVALAFFAFGKDKVTNQLSTRS